MGAFTHSVAKRWCKSHREDYRDRRTGEVNHTELAEQCAAAFGVDGLDGPLDCDTHWIWDVALECGL